MNDTTLRPILVKIATGIGAFTDNDVAAARAELFAIDNRADQAAKDVVRNESERLAREAGAKVVFALDDFAKSLGFVQTDPVTRKRLPLESHEFAHTSHDWFLIDVSRVGTRLRVSIRDASTGRAVLRAVHDGADLHELAASHSGDAFPT